MQELKKIFLLTNKMKKKLKTIGTDLIFKTSKNYSFRDTVSLNNILQHFINLVPSEVVIGKN